MKTYAINEKVMEGERNLRRGRCILCEAHGVTNYLDKGEGYMVWIPSRGKRMVCSEHYINRGAISYHSNALRGVNKIGTHKTTTLASTPLGIEVETSLHNASDSEYTALRALVESCTFCYMESDCTVSGELPTQPMEGLNRISKILQSLEMHNQLSILSHNSCGAHIHVECICIPYVRRYYHSIFLPLNNYIDSLGAERRVEVFGSDFRYYATRINEYSNPQEHTNIFNTQHAHTLEFRLPRVIGYKQYMNVLKFWREVVCYINNYDFKEDADAVTRKATARICGEALVKIAKKYF